jgi:hypothetical protein
MTGRAAQFRDLYMKLPVPRRDRLGESGYGCGERLMSTASECAWMVTASAGCNVISVALGASGAIECDLPAHCVLAWRQGELIVDPAGVHEDEQVVIDGLPSVPLVCCHRAAVKEYLERGSGNAPLGSRLAVLVETGAVWDGQ